MMNEPSQAIAPTAEFRQCFGCNYETYTYETACPRCGKKVFFTSASIRKRGIVVLLAGLSIAAIMGGVAAFVAMMLLGASRNTASAQSIAEDRTTLIGIYIFFGLVICLGLHFVASGLWMIVAGKRNRVMLWLMWALLFVVSAAIGLLTVVM